MASASTERSAEIAALSARVAQLEAELARSQDFISSLGSSGEFVRRHLQGLGVGIALFTTDWRQVPFLSVTAETVLGRSRQELLADPGAWLRSIDPQDAAEFQAAVSTAVAGTAAEATYRIVRPDGVRWVRSRLSLAMASTEQPHLLVSFKDITDGKLADDALRDSEARYRRIVETATDGIVVMDADQRVLFANARMGEILKAKPSELIGKQAQEFLRPDNLERLHDGMERRKQGISECYQMEILAADGERRWLRITASPLFNKSGEFIDSLAMISDITDQVRAEEALRDSEQRFRLLADSSPIGIFLSDQCGRLVYANLRLQAIFGYSAAELAGMGFERIFHPDDRAEAVANWLRVAGGTDAHDLERRFVNGAGEMRCLRVRSAPIETSTGSVLGRVSTIEDITDRRRADEQLRASEVLYRLLAEYSTDVISKHAIDGTVLYVSPASRSLLGYEPDELIGKNPQELIHLDDLAGVYASGDLGCKPEGFATLSFRMYRRDGERIWIETTYQVVPSSEPDGPPEILAVSRDVTVRRQAAEQLFESEARLRSILNTVADGIVTVNESGMIEQFNPGAERLFGYVAGEVLGQHVRMLIPQAVAAYFQGDARRRLGFHGQFSRAREVEGRRKDGTKRELEMRVGETEIAGRYIYTAVLHDIAERKRTQRMLGESEKLAATGRIAARIAHEINNPLAGIRNSFLLIEDAIPRNHPYYGYLARIEREIDRIARIIRQMFDLYRPDQVTRRPMELDRTIRDVVALLGTVAPARRVKLAVETSGAGGTVRLPEDSLRQVLYNVIINAIEASPEGGLVRIHAGLKDDVVEVLVSDHGDGIPSELRSQIYEPFFTTKNQSGSGGLGLGLSISRGIVEAMQGTLDFESVPGQGTVFRLRISVRDQETEVAHA